MVCRIGTSGFKYKAMFCASVNASRTSRNKVRNLEK